ncbi:hypothetical protein Pyn_35427 [Prunus yedoensis var. nudiflora]|uniref:TF-B3 domain-containing protein n=1 Tax=Prunus yedoensis var. nudiflora TaxID=2094558 RepID=A0A314XPS9_PRUYE|nr:hypothetical protein Pyn_35427 [Prunus yedoensis var. nudiflora]
MAVLQNQKQSFSSDPPAPSKSNRGRLPKNKEKLFSKKYSCLTQSQMTKSIVVSANPKMPESRKWKRATVESLYDTSQAQSSVLERAKEVEASLDPKFPTLLKVMLPSHVTGCFWLGLPKKFCCDHLPKQDTMIVLEDENGEEFETKYLAEKVGLSGGWRGFSMSHKLREGDIVIFHVVTPSKFKVYIIRSNGLDEADCAVGLTRLDACIKQMDTGHIISCEREESGNLEPIPEDHAIAFNTKSRPLSDQSENDSEDLGFEVLDGLGISESVVPFKEMYGMDNFNVLVNGLNINSEFSKYILNKYYELCCSQKSFLHEHLLEGLNCKLIVGVISETINIADAIRACKITTSEGYFSTWNKTLIAFEGLGMNVGFLRARLDQLAILASKSKRFKETRLEELRGKAFGSKRGHK